MFLSALPAYAPTQDRQPLPPQHAILREAAVDLPERLGAFTRHSVDLVADGLAGAHYLSPSNAVITVFVGRTQKPLAEDLAATEDAVSQTMSGVRALRNLAAPRSAPGALGRLWTGETRVGPVNTLTMIWHRRGWRIKIRGTAPAASGDAGIAEMEQAVRAFDRD
jgi:hypothetical protein